MGKPRATVYRVGHCVRWRRNQHSMDFGSIARAREAVKRFKAGGPAWDWKTILDRMEKIRGEMGAFYLDYDGTGLEVRT